MVANNLVISHCFEAIMLVNLNWKEILHTDYTWQHICHGHVNFYHPFPSDKEKKFSFWPYHGLRRHFDDYANTSWNNSVCMEDLQTITEECSCARKHLVAFWHFHAFVCKASEPWTATKNCSREKNTGKCMESSKRHWTLSGTATSLQYFS